METITIDNLLPLGEGVSLSEYILRIQRSIKAIIPDFQYQSWIEGNNYHITYWYGDLTQETGYEFVWVIFAEKVVNKHFAVCLVKWWIEVLFCVLENGRKEIVR